MLDTLGKTIKSQKTVDVRTYVYNQGRPSRECQRALAPLVFWSRSIKKSRKVLKSKSRSFEWHQLFLPSFGTNDYYTSVGFQIVIKSQKKFLSLIGSSFYKCIFKFHVVCSDQENIQFFGLAQIGWF